MDGKWDLSSLYKGFDDPEYEADIQRMKDLIEEKKAEIAKSYAVANTVNI